MDNKFDAAKHIINLESDRLLLRNIQASDEELIVNLWMNPDVTKYMGGPRKREQMLEDVSENLENPFCEEYDLWPLIEKASNQLIGHCGLLSKEVDNQNEIEVIYVIDKPYWGKGYATEICGMLIEYAFNEKNLNRVIALIKPDNKGSEAVAIKNGMHLEKEVIRQGDTRMYLYVKEKY